MKVSELVELLYTVDPDLDVAIYSEVMEETAFAGGIEVITKETQPYDKGDGLFDRGEESTEQVLLIKG